MAGEASEAVARRARSPADSLGGHIDPWGPYAPRGRARQPLDVTVVQSARASSPRLVALPGSSVFHAPQEPYTLLAYAGRYYSLYRGTWFRSTGPGNSWSLIAADRVPNAVLAVLPTFAKVPATATPAR
jgi:hypothetical protein